MALTQTLSTPRPVEWVKQLAIVVAASLFVALCARVTVPLPTPVPLTLQNFGVLLVGLVLGSRRGFAALALYLAEGASGLPVFNPLGIGGVAQLLGPTGGFFLSRPRPGVCMPIRQFFDRHRSNNTITLRAFGRARSSRLRPARRGDH